MLRIPPTCSSELRHGTVRRDPRGLPAPAQVWRLGIATGHKEPWRDLGPTDLPGLGIVEGLKMATDGRAYAYHYQAVQNDLYTVDGLE